jgi:hypothetical protein
MLKIKSVFRGNSEGIITALVTHRLPSRIKEGGKAVGEDINSSKIPLVVFRTQSVYRLPTMILIRVASATDHNR